MYAPTRIGVKDKTKDTAQGKGKGAEEERGQDAALAEHGDSDAEAGALEQRRQQHKDAPTLISRDTPRRFKPQSNAEGSRGGGKRASAVAEQANSPQPMPPAPAGSGVGQVEGPQQRQQQGVDSAPARDAEGRHEGGAGRGEGGGDEQAQLPGRPTPCSRQQQVE